MMSETMHGERGERTPDDSNRKQPLEKRRRTEVGPCTVMIDKEKRYLRK